MRESSTRDLLVWYFVYLCSFLVPRRRRRLVFGSPYRAFQGNAKHLFIYACENRPDLEVAWLSRSQATVRSIRAIGFKAYNTYTFKGIWYALTAKYWYYNSFASDIIFYCSGGATCINLWHGVGIKCIERNIKSGYYYEVKQHPTLEYRFHHPHNYVRPSYVLSSNPFQTHFFSTSFGVPTRRCLEYGYPRNAILMAEENERQRFIRQYEPEETMPLIEMLGQYSRVLIYMPTWRDSQRDLFTQTFDFDRLNAVLQERNELLILKPHPMLTIKDSVEGLSNIIQLDRKVEVYSILPYTHVLITDYSSVIYDYLLMPDKDVILYTYDYDEYVLDREFFYPFEENVVGRRVYDFDSLVRLIASGNYRLSEADRAYIVDRFWGESQRLDASAAILNHFILRK